MLSLVSIIVSELLLFFQKTREGEFRHDLCTVSVCCDYICVRAPRLKICSNQSSHTSLSHSKDKKTNTDFFMSTEMLFSSLIHVKSLYFMLIQQKVETRYQVSFRFVVRLKCFGIKML